MLNNNFWAIVITFGIALIWLRLNNFMAHKGLIKSQTSRKIIHIGTGPIFVLCWLLFPENVYSRFLAALVPLAITIQFVLVGFGIIQDKSAVQAMSRTGNRKEILRGPLYYGIVFVILTIIYWKESPIGISALMMLCGGDGLADILGTHFGRAKLPWNSQKSWIGSMGMFMGGWLLMAGIFFIYHSFGLFQLSLPASLLSLTLISLAGTAIESLPLRDIDNLSVTFVAVLIGEIVF